MSKKFLILTILLISCSVCYSQIQFQKYWLDFDINNVNQVYNFSAINSGTNSYDGVIEIAISNRALGLEMISTSNEISMSAGQVVFASSLNWRNSITSENARAYFEGLSMGNLVRGDYTICYYFKESRSQNITYENCFEQKVRMRSELALLSPLDGSTIQSSTPNLVWTYNSETNQSNLIFKLTVVELLEEQSEQDAINRNTPLVFLNNHPTTIYKIDDSNILQSDKEYVWKVSLCNTEGEILLETDIWRFNLDRNIEEEERVVSSNYVYAKTRINSDLYLAKDSLRVVYNNRYYDEYLSYQIVDLNTNEEIPEKDALPKIELNGGLNYLVIPILDYESLLPKNKYLVQLNAGEGRQQYVNFYILE